MDPFWSAIVEGLVKAGIPALLMAVAVWWLVRGNSGLIKELQEERRAHMETLEARVEDQSVHIQRCDEDRAKLHEKHLELALRMADMERVRH